MRATRQAPLQQTLDDLGTPLVGVTFVVLDLETTGGSPATDRITEVGAVKVQGGEITGTFQTLVNPGVPIPPMITALTGISDAMVAGHEPIEVVLPCLLEFLGDAVLVAHNAPFDTRFLQAALAEHGYARLTNQVVCTAKLARTVLPRDEVPNVKLATLARMLHAGTQPCHRAFADARATVDVFHALLERAAGFGVLGLEDLLTFPTVKVQQRHSYAKVRLADGLPRSPGVYLFRGRDDEVLYVGKAKDLRARVRSYFSGDSRARIADMMSELLRVDHIVCVSDLEASVRETRLIQRYRPRYNRRGRDPERYCYLKLTRERWPRLSIVRKVLDDGAHYLGPFGGRGLAELVKDAIEVALPLRRCTHAIGPRTRFSPCALLELGRCPGPCAGEADAAAYAETVESLARCLDGGDPEPLLAPLRSRMARYAREQRYEQAAAARDRLEALSRALDDRRRTASICGAGTVVVAVPHPRGREVTVLRHGQLERVTVVPEGAAQLPGPTPEDGGEVVELAGGPPPCHLADEIRLVVRWFEAAAGKLELLEVGGTLASAVAGGAALHVRYDPRRRRNPVPGEAEGRPLFRPRPLPATWPRSPGTPAPARARRVPSPTAGVRSR